MGSEADLDKVKAALCEAGYPDLNVRWNGEHVGVEFTCSVDDELETMTVVWKAFKLVYPHWKTCLECWMADLGDEYCEEHHG